MKNALSGMACKLLASDELGQQDLDTGIQRHFLDRSRVLVGKFFLSDEGLYPPSDTPAGTCSKVSAGFIEWQLAGAWHGSLTDIIDTAMGQITGKHPVSTTTASGEEGEKTHRCGASWITGAGNLVWGQSLRLSIEF